MPPPEIFHHPERFLHPGPTALASLLVLLPHVQGNETMSIEKKKGRKKELNLEKREGRKEERGDGKKGERKRKELETKQEMKHTGFLLVPILLCY